MIYFPETYYGIIKNVYYFERTKFVLHGNNINYMDIILKRIFHKYKMDEKNFFLWEICFWQ